MISFGGIELSAPTYYNSEIIQKVLAPRYVYLAKLIKAIAEVVLNLRRCEQRVQRRQFQPT